MEKNKTAAIPADREPKRPNESWNCQARLMCLHARCFQARDMPRKENDRFSLRVNSSRYVYPSLSSVEKQKAGIAERIMGRLKSQNRSLRIHRVGITGRSRLGVRMRSPGRSENAINRRIRNTVQQEVARCRNHCQDSTDITEPCSNNE